MAEQSKGETEAQTALAGLGLLLHGSWLGLNPNLSASSVQAGLLSCSLSPSLPSKSIRPLADPSGESWLLLPPACSASCHSPALVLRPVFMHEHEQRLHVYIGTAHTHIFAPTASVHPPLALCTRAVGAGHAVAAPRASNKGGHTRTMLGSPAWPEPRGWPSNRSA